MQPKKTDTNTYTVDKQDNMHVPLKIFASPNILKQMQQDICIKQGMHVAQLPGIKESALMMPDAHQGYGFPIGGVAAMDKECGCLSPGGVGFDINCGMRMLTTRLTKEELQPHLQTIVDELFATIPVGMGRDSDIKLTHEQLDEVLKNGAHWAIQKGYGVQEDLELTEEQGKMEDANPEKVSPKAKKRGKNQLGTVGGGNHFIEIQTVSEIFDEQTAQTFGITNKDQVVIMIHCGSRGLGHQVCSDYLRRIEKEYPEEFKELPEKDLAYAPIKSELAQDYYQAMCAAMNFAWANRQVITHKIRLAFQKVLDKDIKLSMLYDMGHNNAKLETHTINNKQQQVWVHRKGAARAFGPQSTEIPKQYQQTGQPVLIPGSMGTASYVLAGTQQAMEKSFGTTCHGAGRVMSRKKASELFTHEQVTQDLKDNNILLKAKSQTGVVHEAPGVYKDVHEIVQVCHDAGIAKLIVQVKPLGVIKG